MTHTRHEHLASCEARALEILDAGDGRVKRVRKRRPWPTWRLCEVTVRWGDRETVSLISARSRSAARMSVYRDVSDVCPDLTFRRFARMATVQVCATRPADDGYGYVRRAYGVDVALGEMVTITREGPDAEGRRGIVVYPRSSRHYVHVVLDGEAHESLFHPLSIVRAEVGVAA